ncbi:heme ABC exporter ATP-binding protein CcmA [bacterium]|nr:heme ABC exporter ATP-binding protein CcmA [bacterium]
MFQNSIKVSKLSKQFGRNYALKEINLELKSGELLAILGRNGAGKTTFLKILSTLLKQTEGEILFNGVLLSDFPQTEIKRKIGLISHNLFLYSGLSALENLTFFAKLYDLENPTVKINEVLEKVGLIHRKNELVRNYSRGMQQRLGIARAFLHNPEILLLDEPYTGLDQNGTEILNNLLKMFNSQEKITILVTHNIEQGLTLSDKVTIFENGKVAFIEQSKNLNLEEMRKVYKEFVS